MFLKTDFKCDICGMDFTPSGCRCISIVSIQSSSPINIQQEKITDALIEEMFELKQNIAKLEELIKQNHGQDLLKDFPQFSFEIEKTCNELIKLIKH